MIQSHKEHSTLAGTQEKLNHRLVHTGYFYDTLELKFSMHIYATSIVPSYFYYFH